MDRLQLQLMEPIVTSFLNTAYSEGEWCVNEGIINKEDLKDGEDAVLFGIPSLTILHCLEKSSNFHDGLIHLAIDKTVNPEDPRYNGPVKIILEKIRAGTQHFQQVEFTQETYAIFKRKLILRHKFNVRFRNIEKDLFKLTCELTLLITQIDLFKLKYLNVVNVLNSMTPDE